MDAYVKNDVLTTKKMTLIGMFGAVSAILMILEFPVPLAPTFVKMDFSELPIILGGYMLGPMAGLLIIVIKIALNFVLNGTTTMGVGELANMIGSVSYMVPAVLLYRKLRTKKGAAASLAFGTLITSGCSILGNMYLVFPAYAAMFGMDMNSIIAMGTATNPYVTDLFTMMLFSMLPFNLFKYGVVSIISFVVYKKTKRFFHL